MTISKKGRRRITVEGREYLWWVADFDPEDNGTTTCDALMVVSADSRFAVRFFLRQPPARRFLIVLGREFNGLPDAGGCWIRVRCPEWQTDASAITPGAVRRLIDWCLSPDQELVRVDWRGLPEAPRPDD